MKREVIIRFVLVALLCCTLGAVAAVAQETGASADEEFGPVVRAYLGYLRGEQEVVDDRASHHEISGKYYRRNSSRIRALRQKAISIARETNNDYLPELEATAPDELGTLFDKPPNPRRFRVGEVLNNTFRYLGTVRAGEVFYIFERLDPYEQAELMEKEKKSGQQQNEQPPPVSTNGESASHPQPRAVGSP